MTKDQIISNAVNRFHDKVLKDVMRRQNKDFDRRSKPRTPSHEDLIHAGWHLDTHSTILSRKHSNHRCIGKLRYVKIKKVSSIN